MIVQKVPNKKTKGILEITEVKVISMKEVGPK
jgi:hypothetical protein